MSSSRTGDRPTDSGAGTSLFDAHYFATGCGRPYTRDEEWLRFFSDIAERIVADMQPQSVLDAGCALGFLVECLHDRGVEAHGVDISEYAISHVREDVADRCWVGSLGDPLPRRYDLIVSIEVLEHMPPAEADRAITHFCQSSDDILFSSTPLDYKEATHLNVRMPEAWAEQFARHGFFRDVDYDASYITPWAVRFRRQAEPTHRLVRNYERRFWELWKERVDLRQLLKEWRDEVRYHREAQELIIHLQAELKGAFDARDEAAEEVYRLHQDMAASYGTQETLQQEIDRLLRELSKSRQAHQSALKEVNRVHHAILESHRATDAVQQQLDEAREELVHTTSERDTVRQHLAAVERGRVMRALNAVQHWAARLKR